MDGFLWGLLAAYIAGVVFVAYDKPDFYLKHLENWFFLGPLLVVFFLFIWNIAVDAGYEQVRTLIPASKLGDANALLDKAKVPGSVLVVLGGLSLLGVMAAHFASKLLIHETSKAKG